MCMEFLLGRSLKTNLCNLGLQEEYRAALKAMGFDLEELYECERLDIKSDIPPELGNNSSLGLAIRYIHVKSIGVYLDDETWAAYEGNFVEGEMPI